MINVIYFLFAIGFVGGEVLRYQFGNGVAVTALDIITGIFITAWYIRRALKHKKLIGLLVRPLGIFCAICAVSLLINSRFLTAQEALTAFLYLLRFAAYASIYFAVKDLDKRKRLHLFRMVIIGGSAMIVLGYLQYFLFNSLRPLYPLGWDNHLYRLFGMYLDPNFTGVLYVLFFLVLMDTIMKRLKNSQDILQVKANLFFVIVSILTGIAIVLTYSRTALLMLFASLAVFALYKWNKLFFLTVGIAVIVAVVALSNFWVEGTNPFRAVSTRERLISMQEAATIIEKNPIIGVGFNAYRYAQHRYGLRESDQWQVSHADAGTDNSFLFVLATTGIVGFIAYLYFWKSVISLQIASMKKSPYALLALSSTIGLLVSCFFLNTLFYPFVLFWIFGLYGVIDCK